MRTLTRRKLLKAAGAVGVLGASGIAYSRWDTEDLELSHRTFHLPAWQGKSLKIGYISDAHLYSEDAVKRTQRACRFLVDENPDAIFFGGDFVEATVPNSVNNIADAFKGLRHFHGPKCAVLGNHDYAIHNSFRVFEEASRAGFRVLKNSVLEVKGANIVGLDCMSFHLGRPEIVSDFARNSNVILLVHEPDAVLQIDPGLVSLAVAGHSHGGQICLPGGIALHTPPLARKYVSGYYPRANAPLYVSRGLGVTELPFRLFCRPEATIITLRGLEN